MMRKKLLILAVLSFYVVMGSVSAQTFPTRTVSPLLKPTTFFRYQVHFAIFGQQKDVEIVITISSVEGQKLYLSVSSPNPDIINPGVVTADVGELSGFSTDSSGTFPFIGENLNVGDPVTTSIQGLEPPYTIETLDQENLLGKSRTVLSLSKTLTHDAGDTGQVVMKWDREGGFPIFLTLTSTSQGVTQGITITLISSNVALSDQNGQDGPNWISEFLTAVGEWVNSVLDVNSVLGINVDPALLGFISLISVVIAVMLVIAFLAWLLS